ncbi:DEAD/DEAH box helicase family protein [Polaribacter batillariae]|uniref:DEAD/DEAH box helicase family protein n=1 Tax=Polaribacter batillariae TaxID=2808900 RepID=A0ABX7SW88_9FLAO|nr:DEAD/DEAH box helicase family protein [Polaribacter batillariae]QTD37094.1 DEAD/DEAH box helicase family protein [Polaribacter batillariae]
MKNSELHSFSVKEQTKDIKSKLEPNKILIYDAIMGSGKTTSAIERMRLYSTIGQKFIFVTPFLEEINRVQDKLDSIIETPVSKHEFDILNVYSSGTKKYSYKNKRDSYIDLLSQNKNIATTHSLFGSLSVGDASLFKDYILIIDEAINPITLFEFGARDIEILFNEQLISKDVRTNKINVTDRQYKDNSFKEVLNFCRQDNVYLNNNTFISHFPIEIMNACKQVEILTYLFDSSLMAYYFKLKGCNYSFLTKLDEKSIKVKIKNNLNIYEGSRNQNKRSKTAFSKNNLTKKSKQERKKIKDKISYVFRYEFRTGSNHSAFTTFKEIKSKYAGKGYTKGFIPINARATNEFSHKKSMAYIGNRYLNPAILSFFKEKGIKINQDYWALSELIQWIWRGCIRNDEKMNLYIPSNRMRNLLISWLND